ncbi:MAG: hypothetical protein ACOCRK_08805 [bacterium]
MSLEEYEIKSNSNLLGGEKETTINIHNKDEVTFYSDHRTGIKWAVEHLIDGNAELNHLTLHDNAIVGICITTTPNVISLKGKFRKSDGISQCFSMPSSSKNMPF